MATADYQEQSRSILRADVTILWYQTPVIADVQVRQCAVNMGAYLLTCFSGAENPDDRDLGHGPLLVGAMDPGKLGIKRSRSCLVVVDAVQSDPKNVH